MYLWFCTYTYIYIYIYLYMYRERCKEYMSICIYICVYVHICLYCSLHIGCLLVAIAVAVAAAVACNHSRPFTISSHMTRRAISPSVRDSACNCLQKRGLGLYDRNQIHAHTAFSSVSWKHTLVHIAKLVTTI